MACTLSDQEAGNSSRNQHQPKPSSLALEGLQPPNTAGPDGDQEFKHVSRGRTFHVLTITRAVVKMGGLRESGERSVRSSQEQLLSVKLRCFENFTTFTIIIIIS